MLASLRQDIVGRDVCFPTPFGDRLMVYADYVASGRGLGQVERAIEAVLRTYANTHTQSSYSGAQTTKYREEARSMVLSSVGGDPAQDAVVFCGSGSSAAIDKLQRVLGLTVPASLAVHCRAVMNKGDQDMRPVVFLGGAEHHSNLLSWRESVCEVVEVPLDAASGLVDLACLESSLQSYSNRAGLKMGSFSACSNVTGIVFQTEAITRLLHKYGALSFWDYAGGGAYMPIKMTDASDPDRNPDAVFLSPHKFIGGAGGTPGVLVAKRAVLKGGSAGHGKPTFAGGGTVSFVSQEGHSFTDDVVAREEGGTPAVAASIRCGLVFRLKDEISTSLIHQREVALVMRAREAWGSHPNILLLGGWETARMAFFSFLIRPPGVRGRQWLHYNFVSAVLNDLFGIQSRGGCSCAGPYGLHLLDIDRPERARLMRALVEEGQEQERPGWTRLNLNFFLSEEETDYILQAVRLVAEHGHKLLPFYKHETSSGMWNHISFNTSSHLASLADFKVLNTDPHEHSSSGMEEHAGAASLLAGASNMPEEQRHTILRRQLEDGKRTLLSLKEVDLVGEPSLFHFGGEKLAASMDLARQPLPRTPKADFVNVNIKFSGQDPHQRLAFGDHQLKAHQVHPTELSMSKPAGPPGGPLLPPGSINSTTARKLFPGHPRAEARSGKLKLPLIRTLCRLSPDHDVFEPLRVPPSLKATQVS